MENQQTKLWNKSFVLMMFINTVTYIGFVLVNPILAKYVISLGASIGFAGAVTGSFALTALVFRPFTGQVSDSFSKKKMMMFTLFLIILITLGYGIIKNIYAILILRIINGAVFSFYSTVSSSYSANFIPQDKLGQGVGYFGIGIILAAAIGPSMSPFIVDEYGYSTIFYISAVIVAFSFLLMFAIKGDTKDSMPRKALKISFKPSNMIAAELFVPMVLGAIASLMSGVINSFILLLGDSRGIINISIFFLVNSLFVLVSRLVSGKVLDEKGLAFVLYPAFALISVSAVLLGAANSLWVVLIAAALYGLGQGTSQPSLQAYCIKKLGPARIGVAVSTYFLGVDVSQGLGPMLGGVVIERFGYAALFYIIAAILVGGMAIYRYYSKREKGNNAGMPEPEM